MFEKIYHKSEIWFSVMLIALYVIGNSYLLQASIHTGIEMIYTIPFNCILFVTMFRFIRKNQLSDSFGLRKPQCHGKTVLYYIPLIMIASVNLWMGVTMKMDVMHSIIYFIAMILTGFVEEMLFRGFLFQAIAKDDMKNAVIVTSILFGLGHIINLFNGNSEHVISTLCQLCYAAAAGFLLVSVLLASKSLYPCMITHALLNALGTFSNEAAMTSAVIPVSIALCVISSISAYLIFRNIRRNTA